MKKVLSILLVAIMIASCCACHGKIGLDPFVMPEEFDEGKTYEITFWAKNDTNKTQADIYAKAIADFEKLYPNIKVNLLPYTDYTMIYNDVITNIATGTTPNVCITYPDHIATYLTGSNTVIPLDELFESTKFGFGGSSLKYKGVLRQNLITEFLEEGKFDGHYYAIPFMRSTEACYINKTFVENLGFTLPEKLTWDFVWEVSEAATEKKLLDTVDSKTGEQDWVYKINNQKVLIPFIYKSTDNMMIQYLAQKGAGYSREDGSIEIFNDTTKDFLKVISSHAKTGAFSTFKISSYPANFLNAGQCIFAIDSTAGATWMGTHAPLVDIAKDKLVEFETAVMPIPQVDPENPKMISQGPSICIFNKKDNGEVLASWLFAQYLLSTDVQVAYAKTEGYVPVTSAAQNDANYLDYLNREGEDNNEYYDVKIKATKLLIENTANTFTTPVFNGSASLRNAAGQLIENTTKSTTRKETIDDAYFESLYKDITSLYRLGEASKESAGKKDLGALPKEAVTLLTSLVIVWILIAIYAILKYNRRRKKTK